MDNTLARDAYRGYGKVSKLGKVFTEEEFLKAVRDIVESLGVEDAFESFEEEEEFPSMVIESTGRIFVDGFHTGWVKRDAGLVELRALARKLQSELPPYIDGMLRLEEVR